MNIKKNFMEHLKNVISYCSRCTSTLLWDEFARPVLLRQGNKLIETCLNTGCQCVFVHVPELCAQVADLDLLFLALKQSGVPEEDASIKTYY